MYYGPNVANLGATVVARGTLTGERVLGGCSVAVVVATVLWCVQAILTAEGEHLSPSAIDADRTVADAAAMGRLERQAAKLDSLLVADDNDSRRGTTEGGRSVDGSGNGTSRPLLALLQPFYVGLRHLVWQRVRAAGCIEVAASTTIAFVSSVQPRGRGTGCLIVSLALMCLSIAVLVYFAVVRPHTDVKDRVFAFISWGIAALSSAAALLLLVVVSSSTSPFTTIVDVADFGASAVFLGQAGIEVVDAARKYRRSVGGNSSDQIDAAPSTLPDGSLLAVVPESTMATSALCQTVPARQNPLNCD